MSLQSSEYYYSSEFGLNYIVHPPNEIPRRLLKNETIFVFKVKQNLLQQLIHINSQSHRMFKQ